MAPKRRRRSPGDPPYLTVVATGRNDDHGANPLYRTQLFATGLRSHRTDEIDHAWPVRKQLEGRKGAAIRINRREGTLDLRNGTFYRIYGDFTFFMWLRTSPTGIRLTRSTAWRLLGLRRLAAVNAV